MFKFLTNSLILESFPRISSHFLSICFLRSSIVALSSLSFFDQNSASIFLELLDVFISFFNDSTYNYRISIFYFPKHNVNLLLSIKSCLFFQIKYFLFFELNQPFRFFTFVFRILQFLLQIRNPLLLFGNLYVSRYRRE